MRYSVARLVKESVRKLFGGAARRRPIRKEGRFVQLNLEELEPRTPATSLTLFADPLSLVEGAAAGTTLLAGMTDSDSNSNPSY